MRLMRLAAAVAAASTLVATPAVAGSYGYATVVYGIAPFGPVVPPIGYLFDPADQSAPVYIVDQGPVIEGPGIYVYHEINVPTWADGSYAVRDAYGRPFPYVHHVPDAQFIEPRYGFAREGTNVYRRAYAYRHRPYAHVIHVR